MNPNDKHDDDFWNLDGYVKKRNTSSPPKQFPKSSTSAVEIKADNYLINTYMHYSDSKLSPKNEDSTITRFIPPHSDSAFAKKFTITEYSPENPLIKSVRVCSDKPDEKVFVESNLFIRERRALLNRKSSECTHVSYYSYSPRYSQMSRAQLNWYLWWRENTRNGIFLKTDESYIILYAYELAATGADEDKQQSLDMLCSLLSNYSSKDISVVFRMMIRDLICDFCLLHALPPPIEKLKGLERQLLSNAFFPEFFLDLSRENRQHTIDLGLTYLSMYDYKRSKFYSPETSPTFNSVMNGALSAIISDEAAFKAITSFTEGVYSCITIERRPFARMINIVNRSIKFEIEYFQLSSIQTTITNAVRYSENKLREHFGIKNKLHIMSINPPVKNAIDRFFEENYPAMPTIDRRRRNNSENTPEENEYDKLYDVPKVEISPERALEIEKESWNTTKILTEAFADENDNENDNYDLFSAPSITDEFKDDITAERSANESKKGEFCENMPTKASTETESGGLWGQLRSTLGEIADFIGLCKDVSAIEQRRFASSHSLSVDEVADKINECAVDIFGDIVIEDDGGIYRIIEDYMDQF